MTLNETSAFIFSPPESSDCLNRYLMCLAVFHLIAVFFSFFLFLADKFLILCCISDFSFPAVFLLLSFHLLGTAHFFSFFCSYIGEQLLCRMSRDSMLKWTLSPWNAKENHDRGHFYTVRVCPSILYLTCFRPIGATGF